MQVMRASTATLLKVTNITSGDDAFFSPPFTLEKKSFELSSKDKSSSFPKILESEYLDVLQRSDFVELDHCDLRSINWTEFKSWSSSTIEKIKPLRSTSDLEKEWALQLLEMRVSHSGLCDFNRYRPRIKQNAAIVQAGLQLQNAVKQHPVPFHQVRTVFSIVAYKDSTHLRRLIEAIYLPHNLIIVHLEQSQSDDSFSFQVQEIAADYHNVVLLQFGTIIYKSDSISRITLQIMFWVVMDLNIEFDYFASLGGAVYPLYGALELSHHLYATNASVFLGEATMKGNRVDTSQVHLLWQKRLVTTATKDSTRAGVLFKKAPPNWMDRAMHYKSNSGNQAVFSYSTVRSILQNRKALNIFALAKYSCCCCVEGEPRTVYLLEHHFLCYVDSHATFLLLLSERTWIGVMDILGLLEEARNRTCMFQLWGGALDKCEGSMQNAVLDMNETRCFRVESLEKENLYFWGNETWDNIVQSKQNGLLFTRKFDSNSIGSFQLLEKIRTNLHSR